ncbi:MAG: DUF4292 domain-containing protein [bacterium]
MNYKTIVFFFLCVFVLMGCKKNNEKDNIKPERISKILDLLEDSNNEYNTLFIKKYNMKYNDNNVKHSAKGYIKNIKDSVIMISVIPTLGIEMARVYFYQDSIILVNKLERIENHYTYNYFQKMIGLKIDLDIIQKLIINNFVLYGNVNKKELKGKTEVVNNMHKMIIENEIIQEILINGSNYKLKELYLIGKNRNNMKITYDDYKEFQGIDIPRDLEFKLINEINPINIYLNYGMIEVNSSFGVDYSPKRGYEKKYFN